MSKQDTLQVTPVSQTGRNKRGKASSETPPLQFEGRQERQETAKLFDPRLIDFDDTGRETFSNLGELLVYLRETYPERLANGASIGAKWTLPATAVAQFLKDHGYSMSSGSYSFLEQGKTLPGNAIGFFNLLCDCLAIKPSSKYRPLLLYQYLFDAAVRSLGLEFAQEYVQSAPAALQTLRERATTPGAARRHRHTAAAEPAGEAPAAGDEAHANKPQVAARRR